MPTRKMNKIAGVESDQEEIGKKEKRERKQPLFLLGISQGKMTRKEIGNWEGKMLTPYFGIQFFLFAD